MSEPKSSPTQTSMSLPSIHEMFPAHLLRSDQPCEQSCHSAKPSCSSSHSCCAPQNHCRNSGHHGHGGYPQRPSSSSSNTERRLMVNGQHSHRSPPAGGASPLFRVSAPHGRKVVGPEMHPSSSSRQREGESRPSSAISYPMSGSTASSAGGAHMDNLPMDMGESDDEAPADSNGKKHVCPTCHKRFNRPSSLRIHVNTHTGATPFRCPWPDCGREFNVNSNMRRHFRNHTSPGFSRSQPTDNRRKRRRIGTPQGGAAGIASGSVDPAASRSVHLLSYRRPGSSHSLGPDRHISTPMSSEDDSDDESDVEMSSTSSSLRAPGYDPRMSDAYRTTSTLAKSMSKVAVNGSASYEMMARAGAHPYPTHSHQSAYAHTFSRRGPPASQSTRSHHESSSPSPSVSPPPTASHAKYSGMFGHAQREMYTPSPAYVSSLTDTRVSTALRPVW